MVADNNETTEPRVHNDWVQSLTVFNKIWLTVFLVTFVNTMVYRKHIHSNKTAIYNIYNMRERER